MPLFCLDEQDESLPPLLRWIVQYRASQKRICRTYLDAAYSALEATMAQLQQLTERQGSPLSAPKAEEKAD